MKEKLENLMAALHEARVEHDNAEDILEDHSHHDPAIVCLWEVLSANTELLVAIAEVLHAHVDYHHDMHGHNPKMVQPPQRTAM